MKIKLVAAYHTARYLRWLEYKRQARRWLASDGLRAVGSALLVLNRFARVTHSTGAVYSYKTMVIHEFYKAGHCRRVLIVEQTLKCRVCGGSGTYFTGHDCTHCWGSGVYATIPLFKFHFDLDGRSFTWHQPQRLVTYLTVDEVTGGDPDQIGRYRPDQGRGHPEPVSIERRDCLLAVLHIYLESRGLNPVMLQPCANTLTMALGMDWRSSRMVQAWRSMRLALRRLGQMEKYIRHGTPAEGADGPLPPTLSDDDESDQYIPF